jgi:hypothetical protein
MRRRGCLTHRDAHESTQGGGGSTVQAVSLLLYEVAPMRGVTIMFKFVQSRSNAIARFCAAPRMFKMVDRPR